MRMVRFGKTGLMVSEVAFGGIPIMRRSKEDAVKVIRGAIDLGVNFIDTAHGYADSEEKIGAAIQGYPREKLVIASKSPASDKKGFLEQLETTLKRLGTDYVDIYQHHGVSTKEKRDAIFGPDGAHEGMKEGVADGRIRHPAFSSHNIPIAMEIMETGYFEAVQIPFNFVDDTAAEEIIPLAKKLDMGFISMKPMGGGLLDNAETSFRYLMQFDSIVPDPGIEKLEEIEQIVRLYENRRALTDDDRAAIQRLKDELGTSWCHRCDYCQPCPQGIRISTILVAKGSVKRMTKERAMAMLGPAIEKSKDCAECRDCVSRCPYNLDIPELLKVHQQKYEGFVSTGVWA
ncbi:MAG: aldo/keto reductase [Spirochaetales bacterium]|nr:aldo/keto reductase [Spirochaetales bacterium]